MSLLRCLDAAVMPRCCAFCGETSLPDERHICKGCLDDLPRNETCCPRCADVVAGELPAGVLCASCQLYPPPFTSAIAPLRYSFPLDAAIKALKFKRKLFYLPAFAETLSKAFKRLPKDVDAMVPVPLHWRRHAVRGFNQSDELCRLIRKETGLPILRAVKRWRATPFQSGLHAVERRKNLRAAFRLTRRLHAKHPVIVDDVITTGETASAVAHVLLSGGARKVSVLAIARATRD